MVKAMYAFSGDPITYGHINVIKRALNVVDSLVIGIGVNSEKRYTFSLDERLEMARKSLISFPNVEVVAYKGLLTDYAYRNGIKVVFRGFRDGSDISPELGLINGSKTQTKDAVDFMYIPAQQEMTHISSSLVKALQKENGIIHELVPLYVKQCLEAKISEQYIVGVTGEIGCGKSYVSNKLVEIGNARGIGVHNIELDHLAHRILAAGEFYHEDRAKIVDAFGTGVQNPDGSISRKALGDIVFNDKDELKKLDEIIYQPLLVELRQELRGKKGIILINAALIAESDMTYLCNNNVILITADRQSQERRLKERELNPQQIDTRLTSQYNFEQKKQALENVIKRDKQGKLWVVDNSDGSDEVEIKNTFEHVVKELSVR